MAIKVSRASFERAPANDPRLVGHLCAGTVEDDTYVFRIAEAEMTAPLCAQLNTYLDEMAAGTGWPSDWGDRSDGQHITECLFVPVTTGRLRPGRLCYPVSDGHVFVWELLDSEITEAALAELNYLVAQLVAEGLWVYPAA